MKYSEILFFSIFVAGFLNGMEARKQAFFRAMAEHIKECPHNVYSQKNGKQVYTTSLVVDGKERLMHARFLTKRHHYQIDEMFGVYGVQVGPLVNK